MAMMKNGNYIRKTEEDSPRGWKEYLVFCDLS